MNERYRYGYGEDFPNRDFPFSRQGAMTDRRDDDAPQKEVDVDERPERADEEPDEPDEPQADRMRATHAPDEPRESDLGATAPFQRVTSERGQPTAPAPETGAEPTRSEPTQSGAADREAAERDDEDASSPDPEEVAAQRPASQSGRDSIFDVGDDPAEPAEQAEPSTAASVEREAAPSDAGTPAQMSPSPASERPPIALGPPEPTAPPQADPGPTATAPPSGVEAPVARVAAAQAPPTRPGQVESRGSLLAAVDRDSIRSRFIDIQAGFVDEPRQSVQEAERFVDELVRQLVEALETERAKLKAAIDDGSTEDLRLALRGYRAFVDRLLNLTM
jgi:hypothetical protein